jgi:parallel beta-helix repeat protein
VARRLFEKQGVRARAGALASSATFTVYTDEAGTVLADISATAGGASIAGATVTSADIAGLGPAALRFYGPTDGTDTLWLRSTVDPALGLQKIEADTDPRVDVLEIPKNVRLFGATADGVTDDTAAIHAARDAAGVNGEVVIPNGTYLVTTVRPNVAGQRWTLAPRATLYYKNGTNDRTVYITATDVTFQGGIIDGNKANQSGSSTHGIQAETGADRAIIDGVTVQNAGTTGIRISHAQGAKVRNCRVVDSGNTGIRVAASSGASGDLLDIEIRDNVVDRSSLDAATIAGYGIDVLGGGSNSPRDAKIHHNTVRMPSAASGGGICIETFSATLGPSIVGNHCAGGTMGISADTTSDAEIVGNRIHGPNTYGIEVANGDGVTVTANTVNGNALTAHGIICTATGNTQIAIVGNTIRNLLASTGVPIEVNNAEDVTVEGNNLSGGGVLLTTTTDFAIVGNIVNGGNHGVFLQRSDQGVITGNHLNGVATALVAFYGAGSSFTFNYVKCSGNNLNGTAAIYDLQTNAVLGSGVEFGIGEGQLQAHGNTGTTETFSLATAEIHTATLDNNCTFTFAGSTASKACSMTLILTQDATGSRLVTWPASVKWAGGVAPTLSTGASKVDVLTFVTPDNGTTWYGFLSALDLR